MELETVKQQLTTERSDKEERVRSLRDRLSQVQRDLSKVRNEKAELEMKLGLTNGRLRELESEVSEQRTHSELVSRKSSDSVR